MKEIALTPVARGVLIILMTQGKPVKQADFEKVHGLAVKKQHRRNLAEMGLIEIKEKPHIAYSLTNDGWTWISQELTAPKPKGSIGLGPLYAALGVIERLARRLGLPLEEAMKVDRSLPGGDIREPEWIEADESLARALQDIPVLTRALSRLRDAAKAGLEDEIDGVELSADLVFQHVQLAARKRSLALEGQIGAEAAYDPVLFYSDDDVRLGAPIRIRKPTVTRGQGKKRIIVQPGLADAIHNV